MAGRGLGPDFVEALARGLDVIACFDRERPEMSLSDVAQATGLARPTARRRRSARSTPTSSPSCFTTRPSTSTVCTSPRWAWKATWP